VTEEGAPYPLTKGQKRREVLSPLELLAATGYKNGSGPAPGIRFSHTPQTIALTPLDTSKANPADASAIRQAEA